MPGDAPSFPFLIRHRVTAGTYRVRIRLGVRLSVLYLDTLGRMPQRLFARTRLFDFFRRLAFGNILVLYATFFLNRLQSFNSDHLSDVSYYISLQTICTCASEYN